MSQPTDPFTPPIETSPSAIADSAFAVAQTVEPDIRRLGLFDHLLSIAGQVSAEHRATLRDRLKSEIKSYVGDLFGVPRSIGTPATSTITVTAINTLGHDDLVEGTIGYLGDVQIRTTGALVIAPGDDEGTIGIEATENGSAPNGMDGAPEFEALDWIDEIVLDAPLADGTDPDDDTAYGVKLASRQKNLSLLILRPESAVRYALEHPNVGWAYAVADWNPTLAAGAGATQRKHNMLVIAKADGTAVTNATRDELADEINALTGANYVWHVVHPIYVTVPVTAIITPEPGWEAVADGNAHTAITENVSPGRWLTPRYGVDPKYLPPRRVHASILIAAAKYSDGCATVESLEVDGTDEVVLASPRELPTPGTISVSYA